MTKDGPLWLVLVCVGSGAAIGAVCRWALSYRLNTVSQLLPLGTLAANWLGAFVIGFVTGLLLSHPQTPPAWRLFLVTGLLGGLTTFSTFSQEAVALLTNGAWLRAALHLTLHTGGSLLLTSIGLLVAGSVAKSL